MQIKGSTYAIFGTHHLVPNLPIYVYQVVKCIIRLGLSLLSIACVCVCVCIDIYMNMSPVNNAKLIHKQ
jgi:hypothetical protein